MICKYCNADNKVYDTVNHLSETKADVSVITDKQNRMIFTAEMATYEIPINFCPMCGRDLSKPYVPNTEQEYSNILRTNFKQKLDADGMSLSTLAKESNIAKSTLSEFLSGKIDCISASKIAVIAEVLKIPVDELFMG